MHLKHHKPRRQRIDEDSGLVFAWRVSGGSFWRSTLAVAIAAGLFAAAAAVLKIDSPSEQARGRESSGLMLLWTGDPAAQELLTATDVDEPFPDRWEPQQSGLLLAEADRLGAELEKRGAYRPRLRPRLDPPAAPELPGLLSAAGPVLPPPITGIDPVPAAQVPAEVLVRAEGLGDLGPRWHAPVIRWEDDDAAALLGREASYLLGVDSGGAVTFCLATDTGGLDNKLNEILANWLRKQALAPADDQEGTAWGVVRVWFETKAPEEGEGP